MITTSDAKARASESLNGFPDDVRAAYIAYAQTRDLESLDRVVLGVLHFYLVKKPASGIETLPGSTRLVADLGCDSLTMMDTVFLVESLFDVKLDDNQLPLLETIDDLRLYLRKVTATASS